MTEDKKLDSIYTVIDLGDRRFITAIQGFTLCDPTIEGSRPSPIALGNEEIIEERIGKLEEGIATFAIASPYGTKEYTVRKLQAVDDTVMVINGLDFCRMDSDDPAVTAPIVICFKLSSEPNDDLTPLAYDYDEADGSGFVDHEGNAITLACYTRDVLDITYAGDGLFIIDVLDGAAYCESRRVILEQRTVGLSNLANVEHYFKNDPKGTKYTNVVHVDDNGEIKLGDEEQLDEILTTMAELEEIQESNEGTLEEDPEVNKEVDAIFKASPMLKDLEGNEFNLLGEGSIEKIEAILDTLKKQLSEAKRILNRKVLKSQLPVSQRQQLLKDLTQELRPIEAQIKQFEELIPQLAILKEALNVTGQMADVRNAALEETKEVTEPK